MSKFDSVVGIAWDDVPGYLEKVQRELNEDAERRHISFRLTDNLAEFRAWREQNNYDFVLLDIFDMDSPIRGQATPEGLNECVAIRKRHPEMPIVLATDLFDTIDQHAQNQWNLGAATCLWSKSLRPNWFAHQLAKHLRQCGLVVESKSLLILGELSPTEKKTLTTRLRRFGINPKYQKSLDTKGCWDDVEEKIQSFAAFLAVARRGGKDRVALDIGRILAMPRGKHRLVVACPNGEFPWLEQDLRDNPALIYPNDGSFQITDDLIKRIMDVLES